MLLFHSARKTKQASYFPQLREDLSDAQTDAFLSPTPKPQGIGQLHLFCLYRESISSCVLIIGRINE